MRVGVRIRARVRLGFGADPCDELEDHAGGEAAFAGWLLGVGDDLFQAGEGEMGEFGQLVGERGGKVGGQDASGHGTPLVSSLVSE